MRTDSTISPPKPARVTANVKYAVVVCNEYKVNAVHFKSKWGEDELPIVDRYAVDRGAPESV